MHKNIYIACHTDEDEYFMKHGLRMALKTNVYFAHFKCEGLLNFTEIRDTVFLCHIIYIKYIVIYKSILFSDINLCNSQDQITIFIKLLYHYSEQEEE